MASHIDNAVELFRNTGAFYGRLIAIGGGGFLCVERPLIGIPCVALFGSLYLLWLILTFSHGLGSRELVRYDVLGKLATKQKETWFSRVLPIISSTHFATKFENWLLVHMGVGSRDEFGHEMYKRFRHEFRENPDPLLRGDLKAEAERRWPMWKDSDGQLQGQFEMHVPIPEHMNINIFNHDRLITGDDCSLLSYRMLRPEDCKRAYTSSLQRVVELASYVPIVMVGMVIGAVGLLIQYSAWYAVFTGILIPAAIGLQAMLSLSKKALHVRSISAFAQHRVNSPLAPNRASLGVSRNYEEDKDPLSGIVKYRAALKMAIADTTPTIQIGVASGNALLRGASAVHGFSAGHKVSLTVRDLVTGGVLILGGTGSGKSYSVIIPMMAQLMRLNTSKTPTQLGIESQYDTLDGESTLSIVTFDPKAQLYKDACKLADASGWKHRNIGTEIGEFGIDLFHGLSPVLVSAIFAEATAQRSGGSRGSDPFWGSMASKIRYAAAVIGRVYELTDDGLDEVRRTGERIYSPAGVYKLAMACRSADGHLFRVIESIICNINDPQLLPYIAPLCGPELIAAIDFLRRDILTLFSESTVGGFLANVADSLADFVSENDIRERFGAARGNIIDIDRLWDNKTVTNIRLSKTLYGEVCTVISLMLKIRIYHWAARRFEANSELAKRCNLDIKIDEAQEFVTSGGTFSEANIINMSRAMGLSFTIASQSISALKQAMGSEESVSNMLAQLRAAKVFLGTEDPATLKYMQQVTGDSLQILGARNQSRLLQRLTDHGTLDDSIGTDILTNDAILNMSHPLVHGRVEPVLLTKRESLVEANAYACAFIKGEDYFAPGSGTIEKAQGWYENVSGSGKWDRSSPEFEKEEFDKSGLSNKPIFDNLKMPTGQAIVVVNNSSLIRFDKVTLSHELGFVTSHNGTGAHVEQEPVDSNESMHLDGNSPSQLTDQSAYAASMVMGARNKNAVEYAEVIQ